jgi:hypothetical protein
VRIFIAAGGEFSGRSRGIFLAEMRNGRTLHARFGSRRETATKKVGPAHTAFYDEIHLQLNEQTPIDFLFETKKVNKKLTRDSVSVLCLGGKISWGVSIGQETIKSSHQDAKFKYETIINSRPH